MANAPAETIDALNGPCLNRSGNPEPGTFGFATLADVEKRRAATSAQCGIGIGIDGYRLAIAGLAAKVGVKPRA